jgi:hypothetical protein
LTVDYLLLTGLARAFDRTDVPLKNWGGPSVNRSWVYDGLEKIVLAGLAERVLLNTKPLSRVEAARIVAQAVERLQGDQYGDYNHRGYLEELLYRLIEEFGSDLREMGVETSLNREATPGFFRSKPIDHAQFGMGFAGKDANAINDFGRKFGKGVNPYTTLEGRAQIGDFLSFYYQPQFSSGGGSTQGRLLNGYAKYTLWNMELLVGRESLWWGPGHRGSMSISNHAFPLDQVRLSSAEPFRLPWVLRRLGPFKVSTFVAQLDEDREFPNALLSGLRIGWAPTRFVELGFSRMFQFGGEGKGTPNPGQFLQLLFFNQGSDDPNSPLQVNNVMSFDATLRIPDVERYILVARDMAVYFDFGWDDTLFGLFVPDRPGGIVGALFTGLLGDPKLDLRLEYAKTSELQFRHFLYTSGYTNRGSVLSHFIGTKGSDAYARLSRWFSPDVLLGFQVSQSVIGSPLVPSNSAKEKRNSVGLDVFYRMSDASSLSLGLGFTRVDNRDFVAGRSGNDGLLRFEFNRSFGR